MAAQTGTVHSARFLPFRMTMNNPYRRSSAAALCLLIVAGLAGCAVLGTKGQLHAEPSTAADLPFSNDGIYVASGELTSCDEARTASDSLPELVKPVLSFADDGAFMLARSMEAYEHLPEMLYGGAVVYGNYRVIDGIVEARAVGPGGDTNYRRIVSTYRLTPTGPESFYMDYRYAEPMFDDGKLCHRQEFALRKREG